MISSLRRRERTASHSSFLSHNSRRERAEAPAAAAALAALRALLASGSLGLADSPFECVRVRVEFKWL